MSARLFAGALVSSLVLGALTAVAPASRAVEPADFANAREAERVSAAQKPTLPWDKVGVPAVELGGGPAQGWQVTALPGGWEPEPDGYSYQWLRDGVIVDGAVFSTFFVGHASGGSSFTVRVTPRKIGYPELTRTSLPVDIPKPPYPFVKSPVPVVAVEGGNAPKVGATLVADLGTWEPTPFAFERRWLRNGEQIPGETGNRYTLVAADAGAQITLRVSSTKPDYQPTERTSVSIRVQAIEGPGPGPKPVPLVKRFSAAPTPKIAVMRGGKIKAHRGSVKVGNRLVLRVSAWKPAKVTLSYRWLRNGKAIKGATKSKYRVTKRDRGKRISVRVTGKKSGYLTMAKVSRVKRVKRS